MKLTVRGKIQVYKVILTILALLFVLIYWLPCLRVEWTKESFGISEEYYVQFSLFEWSVGSEKQIQLKNASQLKELLGISQEQLDEILGEIHISKDGIYIPHKTDTSKDDLLEGETLGDYLEFLVKELTALFIFLVAILVICIAMITWAVIVSKKKSASMKSALESQLSKAGNVDKLDKNSRKKVLRVIFGIDPYACLGSIMVILFPVLSYLLVSFKNGNEDFGFKLTDFCICFMVIETLAFVALQFLANTVIKDIKNQKIVSKKAISEMKFFVESNSDTSTNQKNVAAILEYKKLLDAGVITEEEFEQKKKQLLNI